MTEPLITPNPVPPRGDPRQSHLVLLLLVLVGVGGVIIFIVTLPSWRPPHNMTDQPYHRPLTPTNLFADQMSQRPLVTGTVPRPADQSPGIPYVFVREPGPVGYPTTAPSAKIPIPISTDLLKRGQERYTIYCSVCHGALGDGNGMVVQRGMVRPPSYHIDRLRQAPDSHFFDVVTNGFGAMFAYGDRVAPADRWAIAAYIRALQLGVKDAANLSPEQRQRLHGTVP